jgi:K+-transporting ATPase ATPase A chain
MDPDASDSSASRFTHAFQLVGGPLTRTGQDWKRYMLSMLIFNVIMFVVSYGIMATQQYLPLNPDGKEALEGSLIFNTAASFTSNTNLQHYSGEVSLSYLSQLGALMWLQFVSAATSRGDRLRRSSASSSSAPMAAASLGRTARNHLRTRPSGPTCCP